MDTFGMDLSAYPDAVCYQVLDAEAQDTGYRIFLLDGMIWLGHWSGYGEKHDAWWCNTIMMLIPVEVSAAHELLYPADVNRAIEAAWDSLSEAEQGTVLSSSPFVSLVHMDSRSGLYASAQGAVPTGRSAYHIQYNTSSDALLGMIGVYVDCENYAVLGWDYRE